MRLAWPLLLLIGAVSVSGEARADYRPVSGSLPDGRRAFRAWVSETGPHLLVVDPNTLKTAVVPGSPDQLASAGPAGTTLDRLADAARARRQGLEDAGVRRWSPPRLGAWLSFDLCPSHRPLDRQIFTALATGPGPLPVMLDVSGLWMGNHSEDLAWLVAERNAGTLDITWVNHSETHRYLPGVDPARNFFLLPDTDLDAEVFGVEQRLLDRGEVPSVFFRFPGLVSTPELVDQILALGLVPLGSSAWLAKQQTVKPGSVVLTHANGNEPEGLVLLEAWSQAHRAERQSGAWSWLGLEDWVTGSPPPLR